MWSRFLLFTVVSVGVALRANGEGQNDNGIHTLTGFPTSKSFQKRDGITLMTSAFKAGLMPKDSALAAVPHAFTTFVKPAGHDEMTLRQFLKQYREKDFYLDQPIIDTFKALLPLPKVLECPFFTDNLHSTRLIWRWFEEKSHISLEEMNENALHCLVDGKGKFHTKDKKEKDVSMKIKPGDCLYLPPQQKLNWKLEERVVIVSMTWLGEHPSSKSCPEEPENKEKVLADFNFKEDPSADIFQLLTLNTLSTFLEGYHMTSNCSQDTFNRRLKKKLQKLQWNEESQEIADELFQQMDSNKDGVLSVEDIEDFTPREVRHLAGVLEDRFADLNDIAEDQQDEEHKKKRGPIGMTEDMKIDYEKELQAILEEGFNEILQEANIQGKVSFDKDGNPLVTRTGFEESSEPVMESSTPKTSEAEKGSPEPKDEL